MLKLILSNLDGEIAESTIIIDEFYSHELKIHKMYIPEGFEGNVTVKYVHEIDTFKNTKSILALMLIVLLLEYDHVVNVEFDYLPFSRMDKVDNQYEETLRPLVRFLEEHGNRFKSVSTHAPSAIGEFMYEEESFEDVESPHVKTVEALGKEEGTYLVAVDAGARKRYKSLHFPIEFEKKRIDGNIVKQEVLRGKEILERNDKKKFILIDDICSMGTTFTNVGKELRKYDPDCELHLYVHFMEAQSLNIGLNKELFQVFDSVKFIKII